MMGGPDLLHPASRPSRASAASPRHAPVHFGSAPLLKSTFAEFEARIGMRILERYGMSEAAIITTNPLKGERLAGSVGFPLPGVILRVADDGILQIKGPSVSSGYWRIPEKTREAFTADGYFITGDVGRQHPDGRVWISGRAR